MLEASGTLMDGILVAISVGVIVFLLALYLRITVLFPLSKLLFGDYTTLDTAIRLWFGNLKRRWL